MILDFTQYDMALWGALVAVFVFGVFIGTWWWYGMRVTEARARARAAAPAPIPVSRGTSPRAAPSLASS